MTLSWFGRFGAPAGAVALAVVVTAACSSSSPGQGQGSATQVITQPVSSPSSTAASSMTSSSAPSASTAPSASSDPSSSGSADASSCSAARYCDTFTSSSDAWSNSNTANFAAGWSNYLGGTFRMTERHASTLPETAPFDIFKASPTGSVVVDVNATIGGQSPATSEYGISCWNQRASNGGVSAFLFFFGRNGAEIGLWDYYDGTYHQIKAVKWSGVVQPAPYQNKVRAICVKANDRYGTVAKLGLAVNGHTLITTYANSSKNYEWKSSNQVGLLASGTAADVFYDNFAVSAY